MTFLSHRKRRIIRRASPAKWATTIISGVAVWLAFWPSAHGQTIPAPEYNGQVITPKFVPVGQRPVPQLFPADFTQPAPVKPFVADQRNIESAAKNAAASGGVDKSVRTEDPIEIIRTELPGPQRLFMRDSEAVFYDRIRQDAKRQQGAGPAIFPDEPIISKESYTLVPYPRIDPMSKQPYPKMTEAVEPCYVCHQRLLFEQPNFERIGYDFGICQPGLQMGKFYYDFVMLPYHLSSNFKVRGECSVGKCLPGDQAPFTVPIERFSVTGVIGEAAVIIGGFYLFP